MWSESKRKKSVLAGKLWISVSFNKYACIVEIYVETENLGL